MEQVMKAVHMGVAAVLFALAIWMLLQFNSLMSETNQKVNRNQRNAEVVLVG